MAVSIAEPPQERAAATSTNNRLADTAPVRGALRIEVGTSSPILEAGRSFSILVTIQNPFDVPVEIMAVTTVAPIEFVDVERRSYEHERKTAIMNARKLAKDMLTEKTPWEKLNPVIQEVIALVAGVVPFGRSLARVAYNASHVIVASSTAAPSTDHVDSSVDLTQIKQDLATAASSTGDNKLEAFKRTMDIFNAEIDRVERDRVSSYTLYPGNSNVQIFTLSTTRSLFFPPSTYDIPIQIKYMIGTTINHDSVKYRLSIRSPLRAVISGSIAGSIAGFLLKDIFEERAIITILSGGGLSALFTWLVALFGNVVLAIVAVVAFARKRDTQPFISVEDFWGGLFVGAVAGYTGKSMIHGLLSSGTGTPSKGP